KERRSARNCLAQRRDQSALAERAHERAKVADAGKNQGVAVHERLRRGCPERFDSDVGERTFNGRKVSRSIFHQCDFHSKPFVLGSTRFNCGSRVAAKRSALANALKIAST